MIIPSAVLAVDVMHHAQPFYGRSPISGDKQTFQVRLLSPQNGTALLKGLELQSGHIPLRYRFYSGSPDIARVDDPGCSRKNNHTSFDEKLFSCKRNSTDLEGFPSQVRIILCM